MDLEALEQRITRLEDIEAIKQLKARYCDICDDDHNPDRIASVFAADGIWESPDFGKANGHAEIIELFEGFKAMFNFSQHNLMNPIIEVNGDTATAQWYMLGPWNFTEDGRKQWFALRYNDDYVKQNGEWLYSHLRVVLRMDESRVMD